MREEDIIRRVDAIFVDAMSQPIREPTEAEYATAGMLMVDAILATDPDVESATYDAATRSVKVRFRGDASGFPFLISYSAE